jgi:hypothetical protein
MEKFEENKDYNFIKRIYDYKYDLMEVLVFWFNKKVELSTNKNVKQKIEKELNKDALLEEEANTKQVNKKEVRVKYDYKNPDENIKDLIPLCNDILIIGKADS